MRIIYDDHADSNLSQVDLPKGGTIKPTTQVDGSRPQHQPGGLQSQPDHPKTHFAPDCICRMAGSFTESLKHYIRVICRMQTTGLCSVQTTDLFIQTTDLLSVETAYLLPVQTTDCVARADHRFVVCTDNRFVVCTDSRSVVCTDNRFAVCMDNKSVVCTGSTNRH